MPDTGAPWNLRYPDPTDLVVDGPEQFQDLAEDVAAGLTTIDSTISRTGSDATQVRVGDNGVVSVADATSPSPIVRPLPFAMDAGTVTSSSSANVTVTFPTGRFTAAPALAGNTFSNANRLVRFLSISSTSFAVQTYQANDANRTTDSLTWIALQI